MGSRKSATDRREERNLSYKLQRAQIRASLINNLIHWGGLGFVVFWFYKAVAVLAGETTTADIGIEILTDVRIADALAWIFGAGCLGYGVRQRKLRRDVTERLSARQQSLEKEIDPKRSSSKLTPRGETNPEDRL